VQHGKVDSRKTSVVSELLFIVKSWDVCDLAWWHTDSTQVLQWITGYADLSKNEHQNIVLSGYVMVTQPSYILNKLLDKLIGGLVKYVIDSQKLY
jgi:hypothetical protein